MTMQFLLCIALFTVFDYLHANKPHVNNGIACSAQPISSYPPDISFCIVDFKYNKPHLKICEFGEGIVSGFYGYQRLYGTGRIWSAFWTFLAQFKAPIFYVDPRHRSYTAMAERSLEILKQINGNIYPSVKMMETSDQFMLTLHKHQPMILTSCRQHKIFKDYRAITKKYPNAILLDNATRPFVLNKMLTHLLFKNDPAIEQYRPGCKILATEYYATMADEIIRDIPAARYVIKPMNAYKGKGIIFVEQKDLEQTLKTILCPQQDTTTRLTPAHRYWHIKPKPYFLVESCESSQHIQVAGKNYDATMRVAFGISYNQGAIDISFFGAYWKLPKKPIDTKAPLVEKYQSHIQPGSTCSARVDDKTFNEVKKILKKLLPKVYIKMIAARQDPELLPALLAQINGDSVSRIIPERACPK